MLVSFVNDVTMFCMDSVKFLIKKIKNLNDFLNILELFFTDLLMIM